MKFAKPIETLKAAPFEVREAMREFTEYGRLAAELRTDITERFDYPSLWAALRVLLEFIENRESAWAILKAAGYTSDDAFKLAANERGWRDSEVTANEN